MKKTQRKEKGVVKNNNQTEPNGGKSARRGEWDRTTGEGGKREDANANSGKG